MVFLVKDLLIAFIISFIIFYFTYYAFSIEVFFKVWTTSAILGVILKPFFSMLKFLGIYPFIVTILSGVVTGIVFIVWLNYARKHNLANRFADFLVNNKVLGYFFKKK